MSETRPGTVPVAVHRLDADTADALDLEPDRAMLARPDGREIRRWPDYDAAGASTLEVVWPASRDVVA